VLVWLAHAVGILSCCLILADASLASGADVSMGDGQLRVKEDFGRGWRFLRSEAHGAMKPGFDDGGWEQVVIPHCFNAEDTFDPTRG